MILSIITHGTCFIFGGMAGLLLAALLAANSDDFETPEEY